MTTIVSAITKKELFGNIHPEIYLSTVIFKFPCGRSNVPRYLRMMRPPRIELGQFPTLALSSDSQSYFREYSWKFHTGHF